MNRGFPFETRRPSYATLCMKGNCSTEYLFPSVSKHSPAFLASRILKNHGVTHCRNRNIPFRSEWVIHLHLWQGRIHTAPTSCWFMNSEIFARLHHCSLRGRRWYCDFRFPFCFDLIFSSPATPKLEFQSRQCRLPSSSYNHPASCPIDALSGFVIVNRRIKQA